MIRKILNYLFLNIFVLINACNYQTINKYYLTENQLEEMFYNKKAAILFSKPEDLLDILIIKQTLTNQIDKENFNLEVSLWDDQNNEISELSQLVFDDSDFINEITISKVIYHLSRKKDVYFTEKWKESYDISIENKTVRYAIKVNQSMIKDISDQIYKILCKEDSLLTINSAEFEIIDILNQSVSILYDKKIYKQIFDKYFALTLTNLSDISQIDDMHVKGLGEMDNEFIISQLEHSLFVFDNNIINEANLIQITLNLKIILSENGTNKTIKIK